MEDNPNTIDISSHVPETRQQSCDILSSSVETINIIKRAAMDSKSKGNCAMAEKRNTDSSEDISPSSNENTKENNNIIDLTRKPGISSMPETMEVDQENVSALNVSNKSTITSDENIIEKTGQKEKRCCKWLAKQKKRLIDINTKLNELSVSSTVPAAPTNLLLPSQSTLKDIMEEPTSTNNSSSQIVTTSSSSVGATSQLNRKERNFLKWVKAKGMTLDDINVDASSLTGQKKENISISNSSVPRSNEIATVSYIKRRQKPRKRLSGRRRRTIERGKISSTLLTKSTKDNSSTISTANNEPSQPEVSASILIQSNKKAGSKTVKKLLKRKENRVKQKTRKGLINSNSKIKDLNKFKKRLTERKEFVKQIQEARLLKHLLPELDARVHTTLIRILPTTYEDKCTRLYGFVSNELYRLFKSQREDIPFKFLLRKEGKIWRIRDVCFEALKKSYLGENGDFPLTNTEIGNKNQKPVPARKYSRDSISEDDDDSCIIIETNPEESVILIEDNEDTEENFSNSSENKNDKNEIKGEVIVLDDSATGKDINEENSQEQNNSIEDNEIFYVDKNKGIKVDSSIPIYTAINRISGQSKYNKKSKNPRKRNKFENEQSRKKDYSMFDQETIDLDKYQPKRRKTPDKSGFIPLTTDKTSSQRDIATAGTSNGSKKSSPKVKGNAANSVLMKIFSRKGRKELQKYNINVYNPDANEPPPPHKKRMVIIDGSNIAYSHALNKEFSVKGIEISLRYFEELGHEVKAIVPQFRLQPGKSTDSKKLEKLYSEGKILFSPCKTLPGRSACSYDDRFILQLAVELDAAVISNDNYRDLVHESEALKKVIENRVVGYLWCNDIFMLPKDPYGAAGPKLTTILNRI